MSCAIQQGSNIRLVPPGDVDDQHAYRQTGSQLNYTCTFTGQLRNRNPQDLLLQQETDMSDVILLPAGKQMLNGFILKLYPAGF